MIGCRRWIIVGAKGSNSYSIEYRAYSSIQKEDDARQQRRTLQLLASGFARNINFHYFPSLFRKLCHMHPQKRLLVQNAKTVVQSTYSGGPDLMLYIIGPILYRLFWAHTRRYKIGSTTVQGEIITAPVDQEISRVLCTHTHTK